MGRYSRQSGRYFSHSWGECEACVEHETRATGEGKELKSHFPIVRVSRSMLASRLPFPRLKNTTK